MSGRRVKFSLHLLYEDSPTRRGPDGSIQRYSLQVYVTNIISNHLDGRDIWTLAQSMYSLRCQLLGAPEPTDLNLLSMNIHCNFSMHNVENDPEGPVHPPPMTTTTEQIGPGFVLMPVHTRRATAGAMRLDSRNVVKLMTWAGEPFTRVVCPVYRTPDQVEPGCLRITDYGEDNEMIMSVLCSFKGIRKVSREVGGPRLKRKRDDRNEELHQHKRIRV